MSFFSHRFEPPRVGKRSKHRSKSKLRRPKSRLPRFELLEDRQLLTGATSEIGVHRAVGNAGHLIQDYSPNGYWDGGDRFFIFGYDDDTPITGDWNGDGKDEIGVHRDAGDVGYFIQDYNGNGYIDDGDQFIIFGQGTDTPIIGDWNGDGKDQIGVHRAVGNAGYFIQDYNPNGYWDGGDRFSVFGDATDTPIIGDWNGDGKDQIGVHRAVGNAGYFIQEYNGNGYWDGGDRFFIFGDATDTPIIGDWNEDGKDQIGVHRAVGNAGYFIQEYNGNGYWDGGDRFFIFGDATDTPIIGDWNGDGRDQIGVHRAVGDAGYFIQDYTPNGYWEGGDRSSVFGDATDTPIIGDWNGDGRDKIGAHRAVGNVGYFIQDYNGNGYWDGGDRFFIFGDATDTPIIGDWNGDGKDQVGVHRVVGNAGYFIQDYNPNGYWDGGDRFFIFGDATDTPIIGDWNGDGEDQIGVHRDMGDVAYFIQDYNPNGYWDGRDRYFNFGFDHDTPIIGDWNGDGQDQIGVYRVEGNLGYFLQDYNPNGSWDGGDRVFGFGNGTDTPIIGAWGSSAPLMVESWSATIEADVGGTVALPGGSNARIPAGVLSSDQIVRLSLFASMPDQPTSGLLMAVGPALQLSLSPAPAPAPAARPPRLFRPASLQAAASPGDIEFTVNVSNNSVSGLEGSVAITSIPGAGSFTKTFFAGLEGAFDAARVMSTMGFPYGAITDIAGSVSKLNVSLANVNPVTRFAPQGGQLWNRSTGEWEPLDMNKLTSEKTVTFVHGVYSSMEHAFPCVEKIMRAGGYKQAIGLNYYWPQNIDKSGQQLADLITQVANKTGLRKIDIEGHSEGGPVSVSGASKVAERNLGLPPEDRIQVEKVISLVGAIGGSQAARSVPALVTYLLSTIPLNPATAAIKVPALALLTSGFAHDLIPGSNALTQVASDFNAYSAPSGTQIFTVAGTRAPFPTQLLKSLFGVEPYDGIIGIFGAHGQNTGLNNRTQVGTYDLGHTDVQCDDQVIYDVGLKVNPITLSIDDEVMNEGDTGTTPTGLFVTLSRESQQDITFSYATANGSGAAGAVAGVDYVGVGLTQKTIPAGSTATAIPLSVIGDTEDEPNRTFYVNLSSPVNATIADGQGQVTIMDDDLPTLSIDNETMSEGDSGTTPTGLFVTLSQASSQDVTFSYSTANGSAVAGVDYVGVGLTQKTIPAGSTATAIPLSVIGDTEDEPNRTFYVNLSSPVNATIADGQGQVTIMDDDEEPFVAPGNVTGTWVGPAFLNNPLGRQDFTYILTLQAFPVYTTVVTGDISDGSNGRDAWGTVTQDLREGKNMVINVDAGDFFFIYQLVGIATPTKMKGKITIVDTYGGTTTGEYDLSKVSGLTADGLPQTAADDTAVLTAAALDASAGAAIALWEQAGLPQARLEQLRQTDILLVNLPGDLLAAASEDAIYVDRDAAGFGWFVDETPGEDGEFSLIGEEGLLADDESPAAGRLDLLTVVLHEMGHTLGLGDLDPLDDPDNLLNEILPPGVRRFASPSTVDEIFADDPIAYMHHGV